VTPDQFASYFASPAGREALAIIERWSPCGLFVAAKVRRQITKSRRETWKDLSERNE